MPFCKNTKKNLTKITTEIRNVFGSLQDNKAIKFFLNNVKSNKGLKKIEALRTGK